MEHSVKGTMANWACHLMKAIWMTVSITSWAMYIWGYELTLYNPTLVHIIRTVVVVILGLTAIIGRDDMDADGKKSANSCLFWGYIWIGATNLVKYLQGPAWAQIGVCTCIEMAVIILVYICCSGDAIWSTLLHIALGASLPFLWYWMLLKSWNGWAIAGVLCVAIVLGIVMIELLTGWILKDKRSDAGKASRESGYLGFGIVMTILTVLLLGVTSPTIENYKIEQSATAYYTNKTKSATLYHANWGNRAALKLPAYLKNWYSDGDMCTEYLYVRDEADVFDVWIGEVYRARWYEMEAHSTLHHVGGMKLVWLSWEDATTVSVDGVSIQVR